MRVVRKVGGKPTTTNKKTIPVKTAIKATSRVTSRNTVRRRKLNEDMDLSLPTGPSKPTGSIHTAKIFLHGEAGIGKTELATMFPDNLSLFFEPGGEFLEIARLPRQGQFTKWQQFERVVDNLVGNKTLNIPPSDQYQTVTLDTADFAWNLGTRVLCEEAGVDDINEGPLGYNIGNKRLTAMFHEQILRLTGSGRGVIFISHTKSAPMQKASGIPSEKLIATIETKGNAFLDGFCDLVICYAYDSDDRYLIIRGNDSVQAKCRIAGKFYTPGGEQVHSIPAGDSAEETYENILLAYDNKQKEPHRLRRKVQLSEKKKPWKAK